MQLATGSFDSVSSSNDVDSTIGGTSGTDVDFLTSSGMLSTLMIEPSLLLIESVATSDFIELGFIFGCSRMFGGIVVKTVRTLL